jgi:hypothetical protein
MNKVSFNGFIQLKVKPLPYTNSFLETIPDGLIAVYILFNGKIADKNSIIYIGRSDKDLKKRLKAHNHRHEATHFVFYPAHCALQAYVFERRLYRYLYPVLNKVIPAYPFQDHEEIKKLLFPIYKN